MEMVDTTKNWDAYCSRGRLGWGLSKPLGLYLPHPGEVVGFEGYHWCEILHLGSH